MTEPNHRHPCGECPFRRGVLESGGAPPETYIGQGHGPFWLPCHMSPTYSSDNRVDPAHLQCAGAATYRANVGVADRMPAGLLRCPPDTETVYASPAELLAAYREVPLEVAEKFLEVCTPEQLMRREVMKQEVRPVHLPKAPENQQP